MTILDVKLMIDIERYRKVNIEARQANQIFKPAEMDIKFNVGYLKRCADQISQINFADQSTAHVYARIIEGKLIWCDCDYIENKTLQSGVKVALEALGYKPDSAKYENASAPQTIDIDHEKSFTLGRWNEN